jgi:hypothetical protein
MRALRIPANPNEPLEALTLDDPQALARALGGSPEIVGDQVIADVRGYRNGDANVLAGITCNLRASRLLGADNVGGPFISGDIVLLGHDERRDADEDCPSGPVRLLRAPATIGAPERVGRRHRREERRRWIISDDGAGIRTLAQLDCAYRPGVRSPLTGRRTGANHFAAVLRYGSEEPTPPGVRPGTVHGQLHGDGLSVLRETVPRFTRAGLSQFTELAVERVVALAGAGDERVARYFG